MQCFHSNTNKYVQCTCTHGTGWMSFIHLKKKCFLSWIIFYLLHSPFIRFPCGFIKKEWRKKTTEMDFSLVSLRFSFTPFVHYNVCETDANVVNSLRNSISIHSLQFEHLNYILPWISTCLLLTAYKLLKRENSSTIHSCDNSVFIIQSSKNDWHWHWQLPY